MACCCAQVAADTVVENTIVATALDEAAEAKQMQDIRRLEQASVAMQEAEEQKIHSWELAEPIEEDPAQETKTDLEVGLQGSPGSVPEVSEKVEEEEQQGKVSEQVEPVANLTGIVCEPSDPDKVIEAPLVKPAADGDLKEPQSMSILQQAACIIVMAVATLSTALAVPWWEYKDETDYKVIMGLWGLKTSTPGLGKESDPVTETLTWNQYCKGTAPPSECDGGAKDIVIALSFVAIILALGSTVAWLLSSEMGQKRMFFKLGGQAALSLSIVFTIVAGHSSTWYMNNTRLTTASYGFQIIWVSVALMIFAEVAALAGGR